jgi:ferredoxin/flavodoxin---NADP+ reductase
MKQTEKFIVEHVRNINKSTYVLRFSRSDLQFKPGQHLMIGITGSEEHREYSIYSGTDEEYLEVLIKEVDDGLVSTQLRNLIKGDEISVKGPYGFFLTDANGAQTGKFLFVASGTGIAPFHSYAMSGKNGDSDYRILHGIRNTEESYDHEQYRAGTYFTCTSRGHNGDFPGRITDYLLSDAEVRADKAYLCGNSNMIQDAMDILIAQGYKYDQLFTEVYF